MELKLDPANLDNWQIKRLKRMRNLRDYLRKVGTIEKSKLLGELGKNGIYRNTAETYLKDFVDAGDIREDDGRIIWIGSEETKEEVRKSPTKRFY